MIRLYLAWACGLWMLIAAGCTSASSDTDAPAKSSERFIGQTSFSDGGNFRATLQMSPTTPRAHQEVRFMVDLEAVDPEAADPLQWNVSSAVTPTGRGVQETEMLPSTPNAEGKVRILHGDLTKPGPWTLSLLIRYPGGKERIGFDFWVY